MNEVKRKGQTAKEASFALTGVTAADKNSALLLIAEQIMTDQEVILEENQKDIQTGKESGLTESVLDRILLTEERIQDMAAGIKLLVDLTDPIGEVMESIQKENGLVIQKKRVSIGVIGMIYEARPNVTIDAATLSLKTGNAVILRDRKSTRLNSSHVANSYDVFCLK